MNKNQSKTTAELLNQMNNRVSSLSPRINDTDSREYQSINNLQSMVRGKEIFCLGIYYFLFRCIRTYK